jgi:hypothetical protein
MTLTLENSKKSIFEHACIEDDNRAKKIEKKITALTHANQVCMTPGC